MKYLAFVGTFALLACQSEPRPRAAVTDGLRLAVAVDSTFHVVCYAPMVGRQGVFTDALVCLPLDSTNSRLKATP